MDKRTKLKADLLKLKPPSPLEKAEAEPRLLQKNRSCKQGW